LEPQGKVYFVLGNHEFYSGALEWGVELAKRGFQFLNNYGLRLDDTGLYIAGIPDINSVQGTRMKINIANALYNAKDDDYRILLSHTPKFVEGMSKDNIDLILSGHTHGGQIYPFHYLAKQANEGHLAGFYDADGIKMYITRGTRYWGPPMRILAPSEITVFNFVPEKADVK
jgi:predicted MPP superfamily phosphohydrolase